MARRLQVHAPFYAGGRLYEPEVQGRFDGQHIDQPFKGRPREPLPFAFGLAGPPRKSHDVIGSGAALLCGLARRAVGVEHSTVGHLESEILFVCHIDLYASIKGHPSPRLVARPVSAAVNFKRMSSNFRDLVALVSKLRSPGGCPWDRQQTHHSLKPMMLEEAYEVIEAIDEGDDQELMEELGDLLLQVVFHSQIAAEEGRFTIDDVIERVHSKMIRRHPHVFGRDQADTPDQVLRNWEALKEAELAAKGKYGEDGSMLDSVSSRQPALMEAFQMTSKVSRVGFDWPSAEAALEKLDEEIGELKRAIAGGDEAQIAQEIGDLLFMVVNVARIMGTDPESALKASNRKFRRRFRYIEDRLRERGRKPADSTLEEMDALWEEAKQKI